MALEAPAHEPKLAEFLSFTIYTANLVFGRAYKPILDGLGITYTQWILIIALWEQDNQTVKSLGEKLFLESNTLTPVLKKLDELGYLRRNRDPSDERQVIVSITEAGRQLHTMGVEEKMAAALGLTTDEIAQAQRTIARIRDNLLNHGRA